MPLKEGWVVWLAPSNWLDKGRGSLEAGGLIFKGLLWGADVQALTLDFVFSVGRRLWRLLSRRSGCVLCLTCCL